jgi:hypothetical protein
MAHPPVPLFVSPAEAALTIGGFSGEPETPPRAFHDVMADAASVRAAGDAWITFDGPEPAAHPEFKRVLTAAGGLGLRCRAHSNGVRLADPNLLEQLRDAGLAQLTLTFWGGSAAVHDARTGVEGSFDALMAAVETAARLARLLLTVRLVLMADNAAEVEALVVATRNHAARFELVRLGALTTPAGVAAGLLHTHGVGRPAAVAAVQAGWEAARATHLRLTVEGFGSWPAIPMPQRAPAAVQPADATLLGLLRAGAPLPSVLAGTWATPANGDIDGLWRAVETAGGLHNLGLELAACGCPPLDLPASMGGRGLDAPPGTPPPADGDPPRLARVDGVPRLLARNFDEIDARPLPSWTGTGTSARAAVVAGFLTDNVTALSTLPALAEALRRLGLDATLHSAWDAPFNPHDPRLRLPYETPFAQPDGPQGAVHAPPEVAEALANQPARIDWAREHSGRFVRALDLSGLDLIVVAGFDNALDLLHNPTLPPGARLIVADFHLLTGYGGWQRDLPAGPRVADGVRWPGEHVEVHAIYPRHVRTYARARVPLRQIAWMPYPLHDGHFPAGPPVTGCSDLFAGGSHQRDWPLLSAAARALGPARASRWAVYTPEHVPPPLQARGTVRLMHFHEAIANARFVILPMRTDERRPAGISVISMALAAGRPVIATATSATVDHLRHGHDAILVPPGNPQALARAIERLDTDDALLERLAAGARASAEKLSVRAWAHRIVFGAPPATSFTLDGGDLGPYASW